MLITKYVQPQICTLEVFGFEVHVSLFFDDRGFFLFMNPEGLRAVFVEDSNLTDSCEEKESELNP